MLGRRLLSRSVSFRPENIGQNALAMVGNLCFTLFVLGVLIFTIIAATYQPEDPLFHPSTKITNFLTSNSNATFRSDDSVLKTGEDFMAANQTVFENFLNVKDVEAVEKTEESELPSHAEPADCSALVDEPINCADPEVYHLMMKFAIEMFKDIHFYRFGRSVRGDTENSCDLAWRFRPKEGKTASFYKDYRIFSVSRLANCSYSVDKIGDYHSGSNARKKRKHLKTEEVPKETVAVVSTEVLPAMASLPVVGEIVNDSLPVVESEAKFSSGRYLIYNEGGDKCKSMNHYLWSFLCAMGEAQYLNRTLVMDLSLCLSKIYTSSNQDEENKDFRFYFDFEHLKESASVLDQAEFWADWGKWHEKNEMKLNLVDDFRVTPMKLRDVTDSLIMRKFGAEEPDNYWYRVCEGETESVIHRPWDLIWKSRRLMDIVSAISSRLNWDFDSVHVVRGEKAKNAELWPNLAADTSPENLLAFLREKIDDGRHLYIATNEPDITFFDPLKDKYSIHFLQDFSDLWSENSEWFQETKNLGRLPVEFDGYMRVEVDTEVFLRGKKQIETFNDLTSDCKDGINTCRASS